jgi:hypothetical protein
MFAPKTAKPHAAPSGLVSGMLARKPAPLTARGTAGGVLEQAPIFPRTPADRAVALKASPRRFVIQPKLAVGGVDDPLEREADRVVDQVMRMPDPALSISSGSPELRRKCPERQEVEKPGKVRRKNVVASEPQFGETPRIVHDVLQSHGQPLDAATRAYFEPRFGFSLENVSIHTDAEAARSAAAIQSRAYTVGGHIGFGDGEYAPGTDAGRLLLAHELAHVAQQSHAGASPPRPHAALDDEADRAARTAVSGPSRVPRLNAASISLERKASPEQASVAEAAHADAQRLIYSWLQKDTFWDYARRGDPQPTQLTPEQRANDPHVIFNNSVDWILSGRLTLTVLSVAPDPADGSVGFDPTVVYPNVGGSIDSTIELEKNVDAWTDNPASRIYVASKPTMTQERFRELLRHEVQHAASAQGTAAADKRDQAAFAAEPGATVTSTMMNSTIWSRYQSEFRSYWLESIARPGAQVGIDASGQPVTMGGSGNTDRFGSEFGPGGELRVSGDRGQPDLVVQLANEKQTKIASFIIHNYRGMEETFRASPLFRAKVQALSRAEGVNLVNSLRIERLRRAIHGPATRVSPWLQTVPQGQDVANAIKALDATDLAFLKSPTAQPFWDDADVSLDRASFTWMSDYIRQDKRDVSPPIGAGELEGAPAPAVLRAKLLVGAVDDPLEREADRTADQVMRMPAPHQGLTSAPAQVSRKSTASKEEDAKVSQTKPHAPSAATGQAAPGIVHHVLRGPGQPLDSSTRAFFEPRFGYDFSRVRIHADAQAAESARSVGALAYTAGDHVVLGDGRTGEREPRVSRRVRRAALSGSTERTTAREEATYSRPESYRNFGSVALLPPSYASRNVLRLGRPDDGLEREADWIADRILAVPESLAHGTRAPPVHRRATAGVHAAVRVPASVHRALAEPGRALDPPLRAEMERRLGFNFAAVRVHTGALADRSARELDTDGYTVGSDVVVRPGRFAPSSAAGRHLIAHELAHVVQHHGLLPGTATVMRYGRSVRGFFANIFQFWDYSKETLDAYLKTIEQNDHIQADDDSDDMARQIVAEWKRNKSKYELTPKLRVLLVREMLDGVVSGADQERIMDLLEGSTNTTLDAMFRSGPKPLSYQEIHIKFGAEKARLELFNARVLSELSNIKSPDPSEAKSAGQRLANLEAKTGVVFNDVSVTFHLAEGALYKSFLTDLVVPEGGTWVTVTLTRSALKIRPFPSILVDMSWPLKNAYFEGFTLTFAGLKPKLDIEGMELVSATAQNLVKTYIKNLTAGTRFDAPDYNPMTDPNLTSELLDHSVIGDINRVRYNLEKNLSKDAGGGSKLLERAATFSVSLNLTHAAGRPPPSSGWDVVIVKGTPFILTVETTGTAGEVAQKNIEMRKLRINSSGIYIYKGNEKIALLKTIELDRGLNPKLGEVQTFVDLKELLRREYPGKLSDAVASILRKYDNAVDAFNQFITLGGLIGTPEKSDVAADIAPGAAELVLWWLIRWELSSYWTEIQNALGVTDQQLTKFLGL